jgi:TPR repeat protein
MGLLWRAGVACVVLTTAGAAGVGAGESVRRISPGERAKAEREALLGDAKAAYRLLGDSATAGNAEDTAFWLEVAAENGHPIAQYNLGAKLLGSADPRLQVRAEYWLSRAAKAGDRAAEQLLRKWRKGELKAPPAATKR